MKKLSAKKPKKAISSTAKKTVKKSPVKKTLTAKKVTQPVKLATPTKKIIQPAKLVTPTKKISQPAKLAAPSKKVTQPVKLAIPTKKISQPAKLAASSKATYPVKSDKPIQTKLIMTKRNKNLMDHFQQCVVLSAVINQQRMNDSRYLVFPLPEMTSPMFAPLYALLSQYAFTRDDIMKVSRELLTSNEFKKIFPIQALKSRQDLFLNAEHPKAILTQLLQLAGVEAHRTIYLVLEDPHDIHKTTLEKYALHTQQIDPLPMQKATPISQNHYVTAQKKTINQVGYRKQGGYANNFQRLSAMHRRGRG